jgi:hypothetical protein
MNCWGMTLNSHMITRESSILHYCKWQIIHQKTLSRTDNGFESKQYEQIIDKLESDSGNKKYLKGLRNKLLGKTEDVIINTIISEAAHGGIIILRFLVHLLMHQSS